MKNPHVYIFHILLIALVSGRLSQLWLLLSWPLSCSQVAKSLLCKILTPIKGSKYFLAGALMINLWSIPIFFQLPVLCLLEHRGIHSTPNLHLHHRNHPCATEQHGPMAMLVWWCLVMPYRLLPPRSFCSRSEEDLSLLSSSLYVPHATKKASKRQRHKKMNNSKPYWKNKLT